MRIFDVTFSIVTVLGILTGCNGTSSVEINKSQSGGLYELNESGKEYRSYPGDQIYVLDTLTFVSFADFDKIIIDNSQDKHPANELEFRLSQSGILRFKEMTERNIDKQICFVVGDRVMTSMTVLTVIPHGKVFIGFENEEEMNHVLAYLQK